MTSAQRPDPPDLLQTFTVTVGIEQLLQSLSGMDLPGTPPAIAVPPVLAEERAGEDSPPVADGAEVDEDVAFSAEWEETIEAEPPRVDLPLPEGFTTKPRFRSVPRSPLPPQIRPVGDAVVKSRFPVLPDLPKPSPAIGPLASSTGSLAGSAGLVPDSPPDDQPIPAEVDGQSPAAWVDPPLMPDPPPVDLSPADLSQVESVDSPVDQAFQSLHLENRFLSRLNALAEDRRQAAQNVETSASLASRAEDRLPGEAETTPVADRPSQIPEGAREMSADAMATVESIDWSQLTGTSSESASAEIVIYEDELLEPHTSLEIADLEAVTNDGQATELLPDDALDLLPVPELILPSGELVADTPITVEVAVPTPAARVGVKLWLCDRQTRLLLDEPRWLLDLQPDAAGMLRASLKMTIPLGCQEARFEAISVDLVTQAESHKAVSDRMVIPPDLPDASLEEFEL